MRGSSGSLLGTLIAAVLFGATEVAAQTAERRIAGRVIDAATQAPVPLAQIQIRGRATGTQTDADGRFVMSIPDGPVVLLVRRVGYRAAEHAVAGGDTSVTIVAGRAAVNLDEVVVTGQASGIDRRHTATSVASVRAEDMTRTPTQTLEHSLQGKMAGLQISQRTGAPGGGNTIRIRGSSTILGESNPLYVVDGVIVSDARVSNGQNFVTKAGGGGIASVTQDNPVNRIADLDVNDIETIEVLKGSSASAIYGSKASNGVILITTKRGSAGRPRYTVAAGAGTARLAYRNGQRRFASSSDAVAAFGPAAAPLFDSTIVLDYEKLAYGARPVNGELHVAASGGGDGGRYFLSGTTRREAGIVRNTFAAKNAVRGNLDQRIANRLELQLGTTVTFSRSDRGLFGNDNNGSSVGYAIPWTPSFLDLRQRADGTWPANPLYPSNPLQTIALVKNGESVWRSVSSARLTWPLVDGRRQSLRAVAAGGVDLSSVRDEVFSPPTLQFEPRDGFAGSASASDVRTTLGNFNLNLVHVLRGDRLALTSHVGTQYDHASNQALRIASQGLVGGLEIANAGVSVPATNDSRARVEDMGFFGQTELMLVERLYVTLGARADRSSANGDVARFFWYPKASASFRMLTRPVAGVDELKLRIAYGQTGNRPGYGDKFTSLATSVVNGSVGYLLGASRPALDLRPERQRELEGGADIAFLSSRANLDVTAFRRDISDVLLDRIPAPSTGIASERGNFAAMRTWGFESALSAVLAERRRFSWRSNLTFGLNRGMVTQLPGPTFELGSPGGLTARIEEGRSPSQILGNDTLPEPGRKTTRVILGDGNPQWTGGVGSEVRVGALSIYALVDHQQGGLLSAGTLNQYILARNVAGYDDRMDDGRRVGDVLYDATRLVSRIIAQDASYTKLRELSMTYELPAAVTRGRSRARLELSGRNLAWWTHFRGGDPEAENFGGGAPAASVAVQRNRELGAYPSSRSYWLSLHVEF